MEHICQERLVFYCRIPSASTAPGTSRRMCCHTHCASFCQLRRERPLVLRPLSLLEQFILHFSPSLNALSLRPDVITSMKILSRAEHLSPQPDSCGMGSNSDVSLVRNSDVSLDRRLAEGWTARLGVRCADIPRTGSLVQGYLAHKQQPPPPGPP